MMKRIFLLIIFVVASLNLRAEEVESTEVKEEPKYKFDLYGFVRTDFFYNSRDCVAGVNDVFYLYPQPESLDANGEDLNAYSSSGFFAFVTRLGLNITGPKIFKAESKAKIEVDFGGYSDMNTLLRIRQAYMNLEWDGGSALTLGQTWHPLFGEVSPQMLNLATGAPFQPFSRTPQINYNYKTDSGVKFIAAALWQLQYTSYGPDDKSLSYQAHSGIPEFYLGVDYSSNGWLFGAGVDMTNIQPRTESTVASGDTYKVNELRSATSGEVHMLYSNDMWRFAAKSLYASDLSHTTMLGGYGITSIDPVTGEQEYAPMHNSTTWVNLTYGKVWSPSLFVGYTKNLGSYKEFVSDTLYGSGTNIDQLLGCNISMSYNYKSSWRIGVEYSLTGAWYGDANSYGVVENSQSVYNHRVVSVVMFMF